MGGLRDAVETFYKRDHVEIIEETQLKEMTFLTDINFTHQMRVSHIRWHPTIPGVLAMSVLENKDFETYLERLTTRIVMTNMLLIWSVAHPLFPQVNVSDRNNNSTTNDFLVLLRNKLLISMSFQSSFYLESVTMLQSLNGTQQKKIFWLEAVSMGN